MLVDCDVIQADGGTRTAAITGAYVALYQALLQLVRAGLLTDVPLNCAVAALSVGLVNGDALLDLSYEEDVRARVDLNVAMTDQGGLVEIQGTAEGAPFPKEMVADWIDLASQGMESIFEVQREAIKTLAAR